MFGNRILSPTTAAEYVGSSDTTVSTDWIDYSSASTQDSTTGAALIGGLVWGSVNIDNTDGTGAVYLKLRARTIAGDPVTNEIQIKAGAAYEQTLFGLRGGMPSTIILKKAVGADTTRVIGEFFRGSY